MSEEEKKGRNRRNSEEEPQEETSLGNLKLASDHCGCGSHCFCFK